MTRTTARNPSLLTTSDLVATTCVTPMATFCSTCTRKSPPFQLVSCSFVAPFFLFSSLFLSRQRTAEILVTFFFVVCHSASALFLFVFPTSSSLGYNHPALLAAAKSEEWISAVINRPALGHNPPKYWPQLIHDSFMAVAPPGLDNVSRSPLYSCLVLSWHSSPPLS